MNQPAVSSQIPEHRQPRPCLRTTSRHWCWCRPRRNAAQHRRTNLQTPDPPHKPELINALEGFVPVVGGPAANLDPAVLQPRRGCDRGTLTEVVLNRHEQIP